MRTIDLTIAEKKRLGCRWSSFCAVKVTANHEGLNEEVQVYENRVNSHCQYEAPLSHSSLATDHSVIGTLFSWSFFDVRRRVQFSRCQGPQTRVAGIFYASQNELAVLVVFLLLRFAFLLLAIMVLRMRTTLKVDADDDGGELGVVRCGVEARARVGHRLDRI